MRRIFILISLTISVLSCANKEKNKNLNIVSQDFSVTIKKDTSNFDVLSKIDTQIKEKKANNTTYKTLDSIKKHVDGADAEYYIEVYKNAILLDSINFKSYLKNNNLSLDKNVIDFFSEDLSILKQICTGMDSFLDIYNTAIVQDNDGYSNLREGEGINTKIITKIKSGEKIKILSKKNDWVLIFSHKQVGYIHKSRLKLI